VPRNINSLLLHRDFFIVLDLRLEKGKAKRCLPFFIIHFSQTKKTFLILYRPIYEQNMFFNLILIFFNVIFCVTKHKSITFAL